MLVNKNQLNQLQDYRDVLYQSIDKVIGDRHRGLLGYSRGYDFTDDFIAVIKRAVFKMLLLNADALDKYDNESIFQFLQSQDIDRDLNELRELDNFGGEFGMWAFIATFQQFTGEQTLFYNVCNLSVIYATQQGEEDIFDAMPDAMYIAPVGAIDTISINLYVYPAFIYAVTKAVKMQTGYNSNDYIFIEE